MRSALLADQDNLAAYFLAWATVTSDGMPSVRTVRYRLSTDDFGLVISTDLRTQKVGHHYLQPYAEACWYFAKTREQFRLSGNVELLDQEATGEGAELRRRSWRERSSESRQSFTWPTPGMNRADPASFALPEPIDPPDTFGLLILNPTMVDYLDLRPSPQLRMQYVLETGGWTESPINP